MRHPAYQQAADIEICWSADRLQAERRADVLVSLLELDGHLMPPGPRAWREVLAERRRQVEEEGYTAAHDDQHRDGELARAAAAHALHAAGLLAEDATGKVPDAQLSFIAAGDAAWPWQVSEMKDHALRRKLVIAAALLLAEIERVDRATIKNQGKARA